MWRNRMPEWKLDRAREMRKNPTPAEAVMWSRLRRGALGVKFRRQARILGFIVDFYCPAEKLVVEVDGAAHDEAYDERRDAALERHGFTTVRIPNEVVLRYPDVAVEAVRDKLN